MLGCDFFSDYSVGSPCNSCPFYISACLEENVDLNFLVEDTSNDLCNSQDSESSFFKRLQNRLPVRLNIESPGYQRDPTNRILEHLGMSMSTSEEKNVILT